MRLAAVVLVITGLAACSDDSQQRLTEALGKEGVKNIGVGDAKITATCSQGANIEVSADDLERNFLGMVKSERVRVVANKIYKQCDDKDTAKRHADAAKTMIADQAKALGIDVSALDEETAKKTICDKLTAALPLKDPARTVEDAKNQNRWGCSPAPAIKELPTGTWQLETPPQTGKKPPPSYACLQNDAGERLTVRCQGKKPDFYVQLQEPVKKGTKTIDAKVGAAKPAKWKVKPSTDGKALFFVDIKPAFKALDGADAVSLAVPGAKKAINVTFKTKGITEALKKLPQGCQ